MRHLIYLFIFVNIIIIFCVFFRIRIGLNISNSMTEGIYIMIGDLNKNIVKNDIVVFCPKNNILELFSKRGYISDKINGNCSKKYAPFIKRVIALSGDKIEIINNEVYLNEKKYPNSTIYDKDRNSLDLPRLKNGFSKILGNDELFLFSTGVIRSLDSRYIGVISKKDVLSKAYLLLGFN